jgi:purine-binding chemotaxis protein CheW
MLLLVFCLGDQRYALHVETVERVLRAVEVTPIADAPRNVLGLINVYGRIIPVFDLRKQLGLPGKETELSDHLIVARAGERPVALRVDKVSGITECPADQETEAQAILPGLDQMEGIARLKDGMVIIEDLDRLCSQTAAQLANAATG